ncbi:hypothetical protein PAPHI01_0083 [Pancytospora philotis]|nr:hypothetical protein PAPHI01_0083 [Pancytospora philotis]
MTLENDNRRAEERELEAALGILKLRHGPQQPANWYEKIKKTPFQTQVLREVFKATQFPTPGTRRDLALLLAIPQRCIQIWFQNARQAGRRGRSIGSENDSAETIDSAEDITTGRLLSIIEAVRAALPRGCE